MCDTLYAASAWGSQGRSWFAKNSDRHPEEAQALVLVEARPPGRPIQVGGRGFPGLDKGHALALSRPSWMEGAEMGVNGAGLAIGNEAVFSRRGAEAEAALGMDLLRAALMAASTAAEALAWLCASVEASGQGGNGAYRGRLLYDNAFLLADAREAYILETAGRRWAYRRIEDSATISNAYSIRGDYLDTDTVTSKAFSSGSGGRGDWAGSVQSPLHLLFTRGRRRACLTKASLEAGKGRLDLEGVLGALGQHGAYIPGRPGSMASPCVHEGGFPVNNATTASMAFMWPSVEGQAGASILWFSGTSYPCLSLMKPILLSGAVFQPLWTDYGYDELGGDGYDRWARHLAWLRKGRNSALSLDPAFASRRAEAQARLVGLAEEAMAGADSRGGIARLPRLQEETNRVVAAWEAGLVGY